MSKRPRRTQLTNQLVTISGGLITLILTLVETTPL